MKTGFSCIAIETSTSQGSVAVSNGVDQFGTRFSDSKDSSRQVHQVINHLLVQARLTVQELDCIAFGCGPGSFTGVRIAASVAQGIAYARSIPVCRVSSLAAMAIGAARIYTGMNIATCLDARMGEAYVGLYCAEPGAEPRSLADDQLVDPQEFCFTEGAGPLLAAGPGWDAWPPMLERNQDFIVAVDTGIWPTAADVLMIAEYQFAAAKYVRPAEALPNYIRDKVTG